MSRGGCLMSFFFGLKEPVPFELGTTPSPEKLGKALEDRASSFEFCLHFGFGANVASEQIPEVWSACCELRLQSQLIRQRQLTHFVVDARELFDASYDDDLLICSYSIEHLFPVRLEEFASSIDGLLADIVRSTSYPRLMDIAIERGASLIRAQPYFYRFSDAPPAMAL
jgi:hypothetical protein